MANNSTNTNPKKKPHIVALNSLAVAWGRIVEGDVFANLGTVIAAEKVNAVLVRGSKLCVLLLSTANFLKD